MAHDIIVIINGINKATGNSNEGNLADLRDAAIAADALLQNDPPPSNEAEIHEALKTVQAWIAETSADCEAKTNMLKSL